MSVEDDDCFSRVKRNGSEKIRSCTSCHFLVGVPSLLGLFEFNSIMSLAPSCHFFVTAFIIHVAMFVDTRYIYLWLARVELPHSMP